MALTNHERIGKAMELLKTGLVPFVERKLRNAHREGWFDEARGTVSDSQARQIETAEQPHWDVPPRWRRSGTSGTWCSARSWAGPNGRW